MPRPFPQADSLSSHPRLPWANGHLLAGHFIDSLWSLREGSEHSPLWPSDRAVILEPPCQTSLLPRGMWWSVAMTLWLGRDSLTGPGVTYHPGFLL